MWQEKMEKGRLRERQRINAKETAKVIQDNVDKQNCVEDNFDAKQKGGVVGNAVQQ